MKRRWFWAIGLAAGVIIGFIFLLTGNLRPLAAPAGPVARDGSRSPIPTAGSKLTLLHFWATWCVPCRSEIPALARFAERHAGDGIRVVAVAQDRSFADVDRFLGPPGKHLETFLDPDGRYGASLAVEALPCTIVLDESGATLDRYNLSLDWNDVLLERQIVALAKR